MNEFEMMDVKQNTDCRLLAETLLGQAQHRSGRAWQWKCPFHEDHATPSFTAYPDGYKCFGCGASGDQISLVMRLKEMGFVEACEHLSRQNGHGSIVVAQPAKVTSTRSGTGWQDPKWQAAAHRIVKGGVKRLPGSPDADYLAQRGIAPATCQAFALGYESYVEIMDKQAGRWVVVENLGPAIIIPWQADGTIQAVQYRLIQHKDRRFHQKYGGERKLFGVDLLAQRDVLVLVEGELNAVSIWQAASDLVDVVSFGPEGNIEKAAPSIREISGGYKHVVVWADKPERALEALAVIQCKGTALRSPAGLDANDLLQRGLLAKFVTKVIERIGATSALNKSKSDEVVTVIYPADAHCATIHDHWGRLADGRIEASYAPGELVWARMAVGYEPTAEELALAAQF